MPRKTTTRQRLITTAAELFWRQGYAQTGVNAIIRAAGATSGSFYHFFASKEELLLVVLDHFEQQLQSAILEPAVAAADDPLERVFAVLDFYRQHLLAHDFGLGCPIGNLAAELSDSYPQVRRRVAEIFAAWSAGIEAFLAAAGNRLPSELDRSALARFVLTTMEGAVMQARACRSIVPFDASVAQLRSYFALLERWAAGTGHAVSSDRSIGNAATATPTGRKK